jgi:hypothetical protein
MRRQARGINSHHHLRSAVVRRLTGRCSRSRKTGILNPDAASFVSGLAFFQHPRHAYQKLEESALISVIMRVYFAGKCVNRCWKTSTKIYRLNRMSR